MSLTTSLISYWKLDEASGNATDSFGSNTLTDNNSVGTGTGVINGARSFNGSTQYLSHADNSSLSLGSGVQFTITCWVKVNNFPGNLAGIFGKNDPFGSDEEWSCRFTSSGAVDFLGYDASFNSYEIGSTALSTGVWYWILVEYDGSTLGLRINNGTAATTACSAGIRDSVQDFHIGMTYASGFSFFLDGLVDEFSFWKRTLTAGERTFLYNNHNAWPFYWDSSSNSGYQSATSSLSWSHNWQGTNRFLAIDVAMLSVNDTVTAMTYGGANCTFIGATNVAGGTGRIESWRICQNDPSAPSSGSNTISVTISGTLACAGCAVSYVNVHQKKPTEAFNSANAINVGAADATVNITTITPYAFVHGAIATSDSSITANQVTRNNVTGAAGSGANEDVGLVEIPASVTVSYTGVGALAAWTIQGYGIRPYKSYLTLPLASGF